MVTRHPNGISTRTDKRTWACVVIVFTIKKKIANTKEKRFSQLGVTCSIQVH